MTLSIIIVSYNTRELTLRCVREAVRECHNLKNAEIIITDNASTDGSAKALETVADSIHDLNEADSKCIARPPHPIQAKEALSNGSNLPQIVLLKSSVNLGFGAANNRALSIARGQYVLLLNSDAFPRPGAFEQLIAYLIDHPGVACVGPRLLNRDGSLQPSCFKFPSPWRVACECLLLSALFPNHPLLGDYRDWKHDQPRTVDFVIGACCLIRREIIDTIGHFDEGFFLYAEETDWMKRMHDAGWHVAFTPKAEVLHLGGASGQTLPDRVFTEFNRGQEHYIRKHHGPLAVILLRALKLTGALIRIPIFSLRRMAKRNKAADVTLWWRILKWNLGVRRPGLRELNQPR